MLLLIDNFDSFTFNLAQYLGELGAEVMVKRNNAITLDEIETMRPEHIVISPGPGRPEQAGVSIDVIRRFGSSIPMLGVCLGHQAMGAAFGGQVVRAGQLMHGKTSMVDHDGRGVFKDLQGPFAAARYHSLIVADEGWPTDLDGGRAHDRHRHRDGPPSSRMADARRAVPSGVGVDRGRPTHPAKLPGCHPGSEGVMFTALLEKLQRHEDLTVDEAAKAMGAIMDGLAAPAHIAGLLVALRLKGERPHEIVGFARAMRQRSVRLSRPFERVFDTCGTGGDNAGTFNVSSVVALVVAACGVTVAKHGNRSVSSRCGSADLFEALGVNVAAPPEIVERCLADAGIAFFFAPTFHPSMRHAAPVRRDLGIRTAFNLLGPLTNPAAAARQLVGVPRPELTELVARALGLLGSERAWVVHGADGLDEISTTGYTKVSEFKKGVVRTFHVHPADFGLKKAAPEDLRGGDAKENAIIVRRVLEGATGAPRDIVLLNAGAALFIAGVVDSIADGIAAAARTLDEGAASKRLEMMKAASQASEGNNNGEKGASRAEAGGRS